MDMEIEIEREKKKIDRDPDTDRYFFGWYSTCVGVSEEVVGKENKGWNWEEK